MGGGENYLSIKGPGAMTPRPQRAMLRYHGGKWAIAPWVIGHFPPHKVYVEPFGGAAGILLRKQRSILEVYNDLDDEVVNVFRVMRNKDSAAELDRLLRFTPFSMTEFQSAYEFITDPLEQARRTIIRSFMGFSSDALTRKWITGFRIKGADSRHSIAREWMKYPDYLPTFTERLQGVVIHHMDALDIIHGYDSPETLFYFDPPYLSEVRFSRGKHAANYNHEMNMDDHVQLAAALRDIKGMAIISGYESELYNQLYSGWNKDYKNTKISTIRGGRTRTEVLWLSPKIMTQLNMFQSGEV